MSMIDPVAPLMRERGFSIQMGSFRFAAWNRTVVRNDPGNAGGYDAKPLISWRSGVSVAVCMLVAVSIGLGTQHANAHEAYSVVVAVPDRLPNREVATIGAPKTVRPSRVHAVPSALVARPASKPAAGRIATLKLDTHDTQPVPPLALENAVHLAMTTGDAQEWGGLATGVHGFVVAGPAEATDRGSCRDLSILMRATGEPDAVEQRRACVPSAGAR